MPAVAKTACREALSPVPELAEAGDVGGEFLAVESWFEEVRTGLFPGASRIRARGPTLMASSVSAP
jgi:hypothetical protein